MLCLLGVSRALYRGVVEKRRWEKRSCETRRASKQPVDVSSISADTSLFDKFYSTYTMQRSMDEDKT